MWIYTCWNYQCQRNYRNDHEKETLANDALSYGIHVLGIRETHIQTGTDLVPGTEGLEELHAILENKHQDYILYYTGPDKHSYHGVGLLI